MRNEIAPCRNFLREEHLGGFFSRPSDYIRVIARRLIGFHVELLLSGRSGEKVSAPEEDDLTLLPSAPHSRHVLT